MEALLEKKTESQEREFGLNKFKEKIGSPKLGAGYSATQVVHAPLSTQEPSIKKAGPKSVTRVFYGVRWILNAMIIRPRLVRISEPGKFDVVEENYLPITTIL